MKQQAGHAAPPLVSYEELQDFYVAHVGRPPVPQLPAQADVATIARAIVPIQDSGLVAIVIEEDVVTREEAQKAFENVQETFANIGDGHERMKEGLHGLAAEIDAVQGSTAEEVRELARNANATS